jgi:2-polyprenyl-3-methyl-5-hydroxy-6-metoxy-1,4-benzoquinol methylase
MAVDQAKFEQFLQKMVGDMGAAMSAALVSLGDRLGLYKALAEGGPSTSAELAERAGCAERYVREWLAAQAAAGYVSFDQSSNRYSLDDIQTQGFAAEGSPGFMPGFFQVLGSMFRDEAKIAEAFKSGRGVGWHEHDLSLFHGTERFFRPGYAAHLVTEWIPALEGVKAKLEKGARVADVGCGHGSSTMILAKAFPKSRVYGYDYHGPSIERAREIAQAEGVADRTTFETAAAKTYPGEDYDLVAFFDCLHDMGDPAGAAAHVRQTLAPDGTWMVVEPFANDSLAENLNPIGRIYYAASTMICTPASLAQEVGLGLGAQAGEKRLTEVIRSGGFTRVRRAAETPFNIVLEARP